MQIDRGRPSRQQVLMDTAYLWASRSTCSRLHVGCVMEREGRILVQGYNGAPAGLQHCNHDCDCGEYPGSNHHYNCSSLQPCLRAIHAEQNAIAYAARWGVELQGATAWVTNQPCLPCAQSMIGAGIVAVCYQESYRLDDGLNLLREAGIEVASGLWSR